MWILLFPQCAAQLIEQFPFSSFLQKSITNTSNIWLLQPCLFWQKSSSSWYVCDVWPKLQIHCKSREADKIKKDFLLGNWCALVECTNIISLSLLGGRRMLPSTVLKLPTNIEFRRIWGAFFEFSVNSLFGELEKATFRNDQYLWPSMRKLETILKQKLACVSLLIT